LRLNNPGWIVEIRQNDAEEALFMPVFGLDYANYREIALKKDLLARCKTNFVGL
jgi:hypothetical protein